MTIFSSNQPVESTLTAGQSLVKPALSFCRRLVSLVVLVSHCVIVVDTMCL